MKSFDEIMAERKKKKGVISENSSNTRRSFDEIMAERKGISSKVNSSNLTKTVDITPVKTDDRKWFQKGAFEDGWQKGDLLKTIKASLADVGGNAGTGVIGMGESIVDALATIGNILSGQQMNQNAQNELIYNVVTGKNTKENAEGVIEKYDNWQKEAKKGTEEFIKQDLYDEKAVANKIITAPLEEWLDVDTETESVFGEKSDALVQSAGQLGATALLSATGVPWWLTSGLTSFGGETENALNQGATFEEATISGLVTAGAEILTEKISGGIKFGGKTLDDALTKTLAANISNKVARTLTKFGMDAVGEGAEEVLSGVMSAVGQKLTYADDKELNELFSSEDAWDAFIGGAVLGGFSSGANAVKSSVTGVDALSGLTTNEKAVFDKVYKDTITEREKGGEKLTAKEKTKIYDDVLNKLEKGYISTDTIESVLGGETYKQYQTEVDNEKALQDEFNTLNKMKQGEMTGEQLDRRNELKEQLKAIKEGTTISDLKSKLSTEVSELAKNSRLAESYNEKSRKSQAFEADLSKYDEKQRSAIKRAIDSGILNNSNRTHEFVDLIAKLEADKGVLFDFTNNKKIKDTGFAIEGKEVAGYVQGKNISINIDSAKALNTVVGHEITHIFEGTELYPALQDAVKIFAESKGEYNSKLQSITELYDGMEGANIENELTAELVGEYLFSDTEFIKNLSAEQPGVFQKVYDEVKYLCKVATTGSKELRQLEKVKKTFAEVYRQKNNTVTDNGVKYSMAGVNSKTHNFSLLEQTIRLDDVGKATSEEIRQQTGWFKGYDGKWRYEINDKDMKIKDVDTTSVETTLGDVLEHQELFDAYPQLKDIKVFFDMDTGTARGSYNYEQNAITINSRLKLNEDQLKRTLIHEIQHAIQHIEGFSNGASPEYWDGAKNRYTPKENEKAQALKWDIYNLERRIKKEFGAEACKNVVSYYDLQDAYFDDNADSQAIEKETERIEAEAEENGYTEVLEQYYDLKRDLDLINLKVEQRSQMSNQALYMQTAGEIEARDVAARADLTNEQRKNIRPEIDRTNVVFSDDSVVGYNIEKTVVDTNGNQYNDVVKVNTDIFKGYKSRNWKKPLKEFVDKHLIGKKITIFNKDGESQTIEFAKPNERVTNESGNRRKVIDKLKQKNDRNSQIAVANIENLVEVSFEDSSVVHSEENNHQWFDANGWDFRFAYMEMPNGKIYSVQLNIANTADGRKILYDINKISECGLDTMLVDASSTASQNSQFADKRIPQKNNDVKENDTKYSLVDGSTDIAPEMNNNIYGEDIKLQIDDVPIKETTSAETEDNNTIEVPDITVDDMEFTVLDDDTNISAESTDNSNEKSNEFFDEKAITKLTTKVLDKLGIGKSRANRKAVGNLVKSFAINSISSREELYSAVSKKFGTQYVKELNDELVDAKAYLRDVKINIPDSVKSEFGSKKDYDSWKKKIFGKIQITDKGAEIDQVYEELNEMYPHLFPDDIWNEADRLMQISDVLSRPKADVIQYELDSELLNDATDYIIDSVTEFRDVIEKVSETSQEIESADISDKIKKQMNDDLLVAYEKIDNDFNFDKENLVAELKARKSILISDTSNKSAYIKKNANELYTESTQMEKGKRVTPELGLLLDTIKASYPDLTKNEIYRTLRTTLLNIRNRPDSMVNVNSEIEKFARELINDNFDSAFEELKNFDNISNEELSKLEEKAEERRYNVRLAVKGKLVKEIMDAEQVNMMGDTSNWKDKKLGLQYKTETEKRNFFDIVRDKNGKKDTKTAQALYDYFMGTYNHNEAELKREAAVIQKKFADLKLNKFEDVFVQMKGEFLHNPHTELTQHDIDTFLKLHGEKINEGKVDNAIDMVRETYDSLIERMNEELVAHGMKPIEYRKGYFPHFSEVEKTKFQKIAEKFLNWKTRNDDIPTDIAGMTESFKPNRSWQSFNKQRIGDETDYSFMKGFDGYLQGSLDWIYHIDDIMKRRVFENRIRYDHSDEGVKKQIQEIYKNNEFDTNAKQEQIDLVFSKAKNPLNNFIIDFRTRTNTLAGKKSSMDRGMEEFTNRKSYSTVTNLSNRVTGNMVAGSISSALTNFIPITQSWGEVSPISSLRAMRETIKSTYKDDGVINKSDFLTNRLTNVEKLYQTGWDKANKVAGSLMEAIDSFTSQTVWRSKYLENMSKGMSEAEAIKNADEFAENLIAGRSRGNMPTIFDSKNVIWKTFTAFQLEVNNQYRYMFKDMPQDLKNESIGKLVKGYATMFIGAYAYNAVYSALTGRDAAFDPIRIIQELIGDLIDDEEDKPADIIMDFTDNIIDELPFVGGILGDGGRVPLSSALPYGGIREAYEGSVTDFTEGDIENLTKEWLFSAGAYVLSPIAGGQIKKTIQGLSMFDDDHPIAGSYTDSGNLRFTVDETMGEMLRAGLFGQYANENARDYFDNNRAALKEKQIQELIDLDIPIQDYWEIREGLSDLGPYAKLNEKGDYIGNLDLPVEKKNILINNIADRDTPIDLRGFENYDDFEEFDFATRYPEKYAVLQEQGISVKEYNEKYKETAFLYTDDFSWASQNPEKYTLSKAVTDDVMMYKQYTSDLNSIEADKDRNGKSISGSKKKKKTAYINDLDIERGAKLILFKSQYKSDDRYNSEIVDYLNSREDITRDEIITILKELDFTVYDDGTVRW